MDSFEYRATGEEDGILMPGVQPKQTIMQGSDLLDLTTRLKGMGYGRIVAVSRRTVTDWEPMREVRLGGR